MASQIEEICVEVTSILKDIPVDQISSIPNCCGAYIITTQSGKNYVGSSKTVRTRVQSHRVYNDPNITEPIKSVCFYLTNGHMDARILEYWLIRELKPELNMEIQPDASTWKEVPEEKILSNVNGNLKEIFEKLRANILEIPEVKEVIRKSWITYQSAPLKNFCAIKFKSNCLQVDIKTGKERVDDSDQFSWEIKPTQAWTFDRRIELSDINQVDMAFNLICQAYEFCCCGKISQSGG